MFNTKFAMLAAIPLMFATAAMAQTTQPGDQSGTPAGLHQPMKDPIAWHKDMCSNRYAGLAGRLAFLEAKLNLTDAQRPAWNAWRQARLDDAAKMRDVCVADTPTQPGTPPTILEREARLEKMLSARLAGLQARRPAMEALYAALDPQQKATFDHLAVDRVHMMRHHWHDMMMEHHGG